MNQKLLQMNIDFSILRNLSVHNGFEKPICEKHTNQWYLQLTNYATQNALYVLSIPETTNGEGEK